MINTPRLRLRPVEPEDLEQLYTWENDPALMVTRETNHVYSKKQLKDYISHTGYDIDEIGQLRLMICLQTNECIGTLDIFDYQPKHKRAGIGILIGDESHRNKGFAKEALQAAIQFAFNQLGLHQLYCNIAEDNKVSLALFKSLQFAAVGLKKDWLWQGKTYQDVHLLQRINTL